MKQGETHGLSSVWLPCTRQKLSNDTWTKLELLNESQCAASANDYYNNVIGFYVWGVYALHFKILEAHCFTYKKNIILNIAM